MKKGVSQNSKRSKVKCMSELWNHTRLHHLPSKEHFRTSWVLSYWKSLLCSVQENNNQRLIEKGGGRGGGWKRGAGGEDKKGRSGRRKEGEGGKEAGEEDINLKEGPQKVSLIVSEWGKMRADMIWMHCICVWNCQRIHFKVFTSEKQGGGGRHQISSPQVLRRKVQLPPYVKSGKSRLQEQGPGNQATLRATSRPSKSESHSHSDVKHVKSKMKTLADIQGL